MSITTEVGLVNLALAALGQASISALADSNQRARVMNNLYEPNRDWLLNHYNWPFAVNREVLTIPDSAYVSVTGITKADPGVVTATSHPFSDGDYVILENIGGMLEVNGKRFKVANKNTNDFELYQEDTTNYTTFSASGSDSARLVPAFGPANRFSLPSDYMAMIRTGDHDDRWKIEGSYIVSDDSSVNIVYRKKVTTVTLFSQDFIDVLAARLAWRGSYSIDGSRAKELKLEYEQAVGLALLNGAMQASQDSIGGSEWLDGRLNQTSEHQPSGWADSM